MPDQNEQNKKAIEQIKDKTGEKYNHSKLTINRVPDPSVEQLQELAYERFAGDYGMTLAYLLEINRLRDEFASMTKPLSEKISDINNRLDVMEQELKDKQSERSEDKKVNTIG